MSVTPEQQDMITAQFMETLVANSVEHWGDPIKNRELLIPYGWRPIDKALYGIAPNELIVVQAPEKSRKTTVTLNAIKNIMTREKLVNKPLIVWDTLESGSDPRIVKDTLLSMLAAEYLMKQGHTREKQCPVCRTDICRELHINPRFLMFGTRSANQQKAIDYAMEIALPWNLVVFGPAAWEGNTRDIDKSMRRWKLLIEEYDAKIIVVDHIQQYYLSGITSDYDKQQVVVSHLGSFIGEMKRTMIALSQVSLTSRREAKKGERMVATGGPKLSSEATTVFSTSYNEEHPTVVGVKVELSRFCGTLPVWSQIEPSSGLMYGEATTEMPYTERPMTKEEEEERPY